MTASREHALDALGIQRWRRRGTGETTGLPAQDLRPIEAPRENGARDEGERSPNLAGGRPGPGAGHATPPRTGLADAPPSLDVPPAPPYVPPTDWSGLRAAVAECRRCRLCQTRHHTVFGVGPERGELMIVGEGPGAGEDASGEPFVGRAGKLLDDMLRAIGRSRARDTFITNVVKCRPPGNRDPLPDEVAACRPYLDRQIELLRPRLILGLGRVAASRLLGTDLPMSRLRGSLHHYGSQSTPVMLTYHPAYLLRSPRDKAKAWQDLKEVVRFLKSIADVAAP
ncbi:MAG TPA: uracil-DNA glycosylase [Nevskiaceae bacterium]|nr:uracil-DNA glycosylase [Nevskiaceae bacterium]